MTLAMTLWLGVDVGGRRKGFDVALIDERRLQLTARMPRDEVVSLVDSERPAVVAIDSPQTCAPDGQKARDCELELNRAVCGIRWTPDARSLHASDYYEWIVEGLALYKALAGVKLIEVFPTASWTRWIGPRERSRAKWTRAGLETLELDGLPANTNQDQRDAIAAALTAREYSRGTTERFGEIVVPVARAGPRGRRAARRTRAAGPA
jgi:predicted nuclease with RNAse H fold